MLNRPLLCGDTRSGGKPLIRFGEVGNLSALVDKPFEILAVLLDSIMTLWPLSLTSSERTILSPNIRNKTFGEVGNLSALVDKPFEILAVLLDNLVLDVLVLL